MRRRGGRDVIAVGAIGVTRKSLAHEAEREEHSQPYAHHLSLN